MRATLPAWKRPKPRPASTGCSSTCWRKKQSAGRQPPELGERRQVIFFHRDGRLKSAALVEQQHRRRVVDAVIVAGPGLFREDAIVLLDPGDLRGAARKA